MISNELLKKKILDEAIHGRLVENDPSLKPIDVQSINDDIPFEIPNNWKWAKFSDVSEFNIGKTPPTKNSIYWGDEVDWVSIADMNHRKLVQSTHRKLSNRALNSIFNNKLVPAGTLLMSFKLTIGRLAITSKECVHNEAIISIYPKQYLLRDYLMNALDALDLEKNVKSAIKGKTLNSKSLANILIPIPPLEEQEKIVKKIEKLFELIDKKEKNDKEKDKLRTLLKEKIILKATSGNLIENNEFLIRQNYKEVECHRFNLPQNWIWTTLEEIVDYKNGFAFNSAMMSKNNNGIPVIKSANIGKKKVIIDSKTDYIENPTEKMLKCIINKNDILMVLSSQSSNVQPLGISAIYKIETPALLNQRVLKLSARENINSDYLLYVINSTWFHDKLSNKAAGLAQANLKLDHVLSMEVPLPPLEEQEKIVEKIEECFKLIEQL